MGLIISLWPDDPFERNRPDEVTGNTLGYPLPMSLMCS